MQFDNEFPLTLNGRPMKKLILLIASLTVATAALADPTCKAQAAEKKLAGAALKSFVGKCEKQAKMVCEKAATDKKLAGAAKNSNVKKCTAEAVG